MTDLSLLIQQEISGVTGVPLAELDPDTPFTGFGIESLQAVTIASNLSARLGRELPVTLFFDYPTIRELAGFLSGAVAARESGASGRGAEPMAIIGLSCRFPGADSAEKFWYNLSFGVDAIGETPPSRWDWKKYPDVPAMRWGGYLDDIDSFDNEMFSIPEPEAAKMDPQQRLLLQCVHEAVESAGISVRDLQRSRTGVFVGISSSDFSFRRTGASSVFDATGNAHSIAANRISYVFNLKGPSISLDTACSSSLVAFHKACQSLQSGECDLAIVGGVNVILEPEITKAFAEAGMLAPDGRCKTFSREANGYVRGEGAGVVLLQRLKEADPRRVHAVVRATAINHDGRTNGLTAPSGPAQEEVIREALARGGLQPEDVNFIEAHGTGTALGDPIEFLTLARVFGGRKEPLRVGSAKAFVGHLEAAAGICGIIKTALSLRYGRWPRQLHFTALNPKMNTKEILVADEPLEFRLDAPVRAAVSSFGFGGTNAHAILESAALAEAQPRSDFEGHGLVLAFSATSPESLREFGRRWSDALGVDEARARHMIERSASERLQYGHRAAFFGKGRDEILTALEHWQKGEPGQWVERHLSRAYRPRVAFAFTGQGSQYAGMGQELFRDEPRFRALWNENLARLDAYFPESLLEIARGSSEELLYRTDYGQALLYSQEVALARFLEEEWGLAPEIVFGHSLGELSAAAFAGALPEEAGAALVAARGRLMQELCPSGAMASARGEREKILAIVAAVSGLEVAAVNGPDLFTLTGPESAVKEGIENLGKQGVQCKALAVSRAFHSALMEPMLPVFRKVLEGTSFPSPRFTLFSSLTGKAVGEGEYSPDYWLRQVREPTQFLGMMQAAAEAGVNVVVEIGPHPVLSSMGPGCVPGKNILFIPTLRRGKEGEWQRALAELTLLGARQQKAVEGTELLPLTPFTKKFKEKPMANQEALLAELQALVAGLMQVKPEEIDPDTNLVDLGADSLLLLNAIQTIKDRHGVTIGVADVFRELSNLRAIAGYVQANKAPPPAAPSPAPALAEQVALNNLEAFRAAPLATNDLKSVIDRQLALMNQQLALLAGGAQVQVAPAAMNGAPAPQFPASPPPSIKNVEAKGVLGNWRSKANREVSAEEKARAAYVDAFIQRFNQRTKKTKEHTQKYRRHLADNRVSAGFRPNLKEMIYTIIFKEGKGARFTDLDGNDYLDFTMGFGVNLFGLNPEFIDKRIRSQIELGYAVGPQAELAGVVAEKACRVLGQERIAFLNSGTEAVMTALRLARAVTGRNRIVIFEGSYHGHADVVLARAGGDGRSLPVAPGIPTGLTSDVVVLPYGEASSLDYIRKHAGELAAVLVEPVQSRYPEHQPVAFLKEIRAITEKSGTAFIFDEVICGLRVTPSGAQGAFGIRPDLSSYGKVLGGGMPIGAVAGSARFLDPIDGGYWQFGDDSYPGAEMTFFAGTFCKHPLAMAACDAVLDRFLKEGDALTQALNEKTAALCKGLNQTFQGFDLQANHFGSLFRFKSQGNIDLLFANLNLRGAYVWEGRNMFLSTAHTDQDTARFQEIVRESVEELEKEGFLRKKP